jgi:hypothetical protein
MLEPSFPKQQGHLLCFSYHAFRGLTVNSHLFLLIEVVFDQYLPFFSLKVHIFVAAQTPYQS